jgi:PKHD-type hydroxylase
MLRISGLLDAETARNLRERLLASQDWVDGRLTAGHRGVQVKRNAQIAEGSVIAREIGAVILEALQRQPLFISAALPATVYPPLFNRYDSDMHYGAHVDGAVRQLPGAARKLRTDVSGTLFLTSPEDYDGGELVVEDTYGAHSVKLPAGDLVLYPSTSLHRITPVTRGTRVASLLWVQSMVRDDARRALLFDMDMAIIRLGRDHPGHESIMQLTSAYHNLLRMWVEP